MARAYYDVEFIRCVGSFVSGLRVCNISDCMNLISFEESMAGRVNVVSQILAIVLMSTSIWACSGSDDDLITAEPEGVIPDPIERSTDRFGERGNLWKPRADEHSPAPGNLVVLLSAEYSAQFDSCEVTLRNGMVAQLICINDQPWTQTPFSCFSNGNRQTWRGMFKCSEVADVKVTCRSSAREVVFSVPDPNRSQVCSRF